MINTCKVISLYKEQYGGDDAEELMPLCETVCAELSLRLKKQSFSEDIRVLNAAAAMLNHRIKLREAAGDDGIASFRAGDVTVTRSAGHIITRAQAQLDSALACAAPLFKDREFFFAGVR